MSFQVGIGSLGGTVFSGGTLYPSANYVKNKKKREKKKKKDKNGTVNNS